MDFLVDIMSEPSPKPCFDQLGGPQTAKTRQDADETYELDAVADLAIWIKSSIQFLDGWISRNTKGTPWKRETHGDWHVISRHTTYTQTDIYVVRLKKLEVKKVNQ